MKTRPLLLASLLGYIVLSGLIFWRLASENKVAAQPCDTTTAAFNKYVGNRALAFGTLFRTSDPTILYESGAAQPYTLWYSGTPVCIQLDPSQGGRMVRQIYVASSADGYNWSTNEYKPVLGPTPGTFDQTGVAMPYVLKKDVSTYYMYYVGYSYINPIGDTFTNPMIALATCQSNCTTPAARWIKQGPLLGADGNPLANSVEPSVLYDSTSGLFQLWHSVETNALAPFGIYYRSTTSADGRTGWSGNVAPLAPRTLALTIGRVGHVVIKRSGGLELYMNAGDTDTCSKSIVKATGTGTTAGSWTVDTTHAIVAKGSSYDSDRAGWPTVVEIGSKLKLFYAAWSDSRGAPCSAGACALVIPDAAITPPTHGMAIATPP